MVAVQTMERTSNRVIVDLLRKLGAEPSESQRKTLHASLMGELQKAALIDLGRRLIGLKGMVALGNALYECALPNLERLSLEGNNVGDDGMVALGAAIGIGQLTSLKVLNLGWNKISERGCKALAEGFLGIKQLAQPTPPVNVKNTFSFEFWKKGKASKSRNLSPTEHSNAQSPKRELGESARHTDLTFTSNPFGYPSSIDFNAARVTKKIFKTAPNLHTLGLTGNRIGDGGMVALAAAFELGYTPSLKALRLFKNELKEEGADALGKALRSGNLQKLEALNVGKNSIGAEGTVALTGAFGAKKFLSLKEIGLSECSTGAAGCIALARAVEAGHLPALESVYLQQNRLGNGGATALGFAIASGHAKKLKVLDLQSNNIQGAGGIQEIATVLRRGHLPSIEILDLADNSIGTDGAKLLFESFESGKCTHLKFLELRGNSFGDEGCAALGKLGEQDHIREIQQIFLCRNDITSVGVASLSPFKDRTRFRFLSNFDLYENPWQLEEDTSAGAALAGRRKDGSSSLPKSDSNSATKSTDPVCPTKPHVARTVDSPAMAAYVNNKDSKIDTKPVTQESGEFDIQVKTGCFSCTPPWCGKAKRSAMYASVEKIPANNKH